MENWIVPIILSLLATLNEIFLTYQSNFIHLLNNKISEFIYLYTDMDDLLVQPLAPPP